MKLALGLWLRLGLWFKYMSGVHCRFGETWWFRGLVRAISLITTRVRLLNALWFTCRVFIGWRHSGHVLLPCQTGLGEHDS